MQAPGKLLLGTGHTPVLAKKGSSAQAEA